MVDLGVCAVVQGEVPVLVQYQTFRSTQQGVGQHKAAADVAHGVDGLDDQRQLSERQALALREVVDLAVCVGQGWH
ncbi:hypothetical protein D3C81_2178530 [compost metagenome]